MRLTEWNGERLQARLQEAVVQYGEVLDEQMKLELTARKWVYPTPTLRFESERMGGIRNPGGGILIQQGPRDIVDTGRLLASQQLEYTATGGFQLSWLGYASNVITGIYPRYINPEGVDAQPIYLPRNFVQSGLAAVPALPFIVQAWRAGGQQR